MAPSGARSQAVSSGHGPVASADSRMSARALRDSLPNLQRACGVARGAPACASCSSAGSRNDNRPCLRDGVGYGKAPVAFVRHGACAPGRLSAPGGAQLHTEPDSGVGQGCSRRGRSLGSSRTGTAILLMPCARGPCHVLEAMARAGVCSKQLQENQRVCDGNGRIPCTRSSSAATSMIKPASQTRNAWPWRSRAWTLNAAGWPATHCPGPGPGSTRGSDQAIAAWPCPHA